MAKDVNADTTAWHDMKKLTRITFNSSHWLRPDRRDKHRESGGTFVHKYGFGYEDWLFRFDWMLDGWRYGFIQGVNKANKAGTRYVNEPLDLTLYTIEPDGRRRYVANVHSVECLDATQAEDARALFIENGWLDAMRNEVIEVGGNADGLDDRKAAPHILNVRFRPECRDLFPPGSYADPDDQWLKDRRRYQFYDFELSDEKRIEESIRKRRAAQGLPDTGPIFRKGSRPVEYDPVHRKMQAKLLEALQMKYGDGRVTMEEDFVDLKVQTETEVILYEIKSDLAPRSAIRHALGQILEYAFYPPCRYCLPIRLVIVGRTAISARDEEYLNYLQGNCGLRLTYENIQP